MRGALAVCLAAASFTRAALRMELHHSFGGQHSTIASGERGRVVYEVSADGSDEWLASMQVCISVFQAVLPEPIKLADTCFLSAKDELFTSPLEPGRYVVTAAVVGSMEKAETASVSITVGDPDKAEDFVIALAYYLPGNLSNTPFLNSLRASQYKGKVVLITRPDLTSAEVLELQQLEVDVYPVPIFGCAFGYHDPTGGYVQACIETSLGPLALLVARLPLALDILKQYNAVSASRVLLTDYQDVYFQAHPFNNDSFEQAPYKDLMLFQESGCTVASRFSLFATDWIRRCFGDTVVEQFESLPAICAGTLMGTWPGIERYLNAFADLHRQRMLEGTIEQQQACSSVGADMSILMYIAYTRAVPAYIVWSNMGPVATVGSLCAEQDHASCNKAQPLLQDSQFRVLDLKGHVVPVIHQYNRCTELTQLVRGAWNDNWRRSIISSAM